MNKKDTVIVIAILAFTLSLSYATYGMGHFLARESYVHALNVENVISGGTPSQQSLFYNFAAFAYALTGRQGV